jgi:tetratricopeptide (TPR) repeat protein
LDIGFGNFILLEHSWGESLYAQLDSTNVQPGQTVQVGSVIGSSGNSGFSNGPHLHFSIRLTPYQRDDGWGGFSDPAPYLSEQWRNFGIEPAQFAPFIVKEAAELARNGAITEAVESYQEALRLDSTLVISPEVEAGRIYAPIVVEKAAKLARSGEITQAITVFNQAIHLDPRLTIDPLKEARRLAAPRLMDLGTQLARIGDIDGAIFRYELALTYDPASYFEPPVKAQIEYGRALYDKHAFAYAMQAFTAAQNISPTLDVTSTLSAYQWGELCRGGSLVGVATVVMPACARAVALSPQDGHVRDSRGLARALVGDLTGATDDFSAFVSWANSQDQANTYLKEQSKKRAAWIVALRAGINPVQASVAASRGKIDEALSIYDTLQTTNPDTAISAEEWNNLCWNGALHGEATQVLHACDQAVALAPENGNYRDSRAVARAAANDIAGAIEDFEAYLSWAQQNQQAETRVNHRKTWLAALRLDVNLVQAYILARNQKVDKALVIYSVLEQIDINLEPTADEWNNLCWHGAQSGYANHVLFACDRAIKLDPENGNYRDSRGLARALTGDVQGAIEDFEFSLQWARRVNEWEEFIVQRNTWLFFLKLSMLLSPQR